MHAALSGAQKLKGGEREEGKKVVQHTGITCLVAHAGTSCLVTHTGTPCLMAHAGPTCLAAYARFLPSSPYPLLKARRPDEPSKGMQGKAWVVGSRGKKVVHVGCCIDSQNEDKGVVGGIRGRWGQQQRGRTRPTAHACARLETSWT
jgi:hypothetical protein